MSKSAKAWEKVFSSGSKEMQARLQRVHAKNPEFQSWLKSSGYSEGKSVKQASKAVDTTRTKEAQKKSLKLYGATKGTRMGAEDGTGEAIRDTVVPLSKDQWSKVQTAKREAQIAGKLDTKEKRAEFLKKLAIKPTAPAAAEDFDDEGHDDLRDLHQSLHIRTGYNEEVEHVNEEPKDAADEGEYDYEGDMAKSQLRSIMFNAKRMHDMIEDNTNLPEWVQSKITLAEDYISTAANYMQGEMNEEVEQIDEVLGAAARTAAAARAAVAAKNAAKVAGKEADVVDIGSAKRLRDLKKAISKETDLDKSNALVKQLKDLEAEVARAKSRSPEEQQIVTAAATKRAKEAGEPAPAPTPKTKPVPRRAPVPSPAPTRRRPGYRPTPAPAPAPAPVPAPVPAPKPKPAIVPAPVPTPGTKPGKIPNIVPKTLPKSLPVLAGALMLGLLRKLSSKAEPDAMPAPVPATAPKPPAGGTPVGSGITPFLPTIGGGNRVQRMRSGRYVVGGKTFRRPSYINRPQMFGDSPTSAELGYQPGMAEETEMKINEAAKGGYSSLVSARRIKNAKMRAQGKAPMAEAKLDPVGQEDRDVDNDGKHNTSTDQYLLNKRAAIGSAIRNKMKNKLTKGK